LADLRYEEFESRPEASRTTTGSRIRLLGNHVVPVVLVNKVTGMKKRR
jgi:hypothetical protein